MIQNKTARRLMYEWHGGQSSPLYAAASSGLVASFVDLAEEIMCIDDPKDRSALLCWVQNRQTRSVVVNVHQRPYHLLPWARS